jgi:hypothetical protein
VRDESERELRCFWMKLRKPPSEVEPRVFVPLCDGALYTGRPEDCTCDNWPERLELLQAEIGQERRRAARAEEALERERGRIGAKLAEIRRWQRAAEERFRARLRELDTSGGRR